MQAYVAVSYKKRNSLHDELNAITEVLKECQAHCFIFVDNYSFLPSEEKQMMQQAFLEIDKADFLIAEVSDKAIGIGVEVGYAKARNKPVIYLRNATAEHSTTIGGACDHKIIYQTPGELKQKLSALLFREFSAL